MWNRDGECRVKKFPNGERTNVPKRMNRIKLSDAVVVVIVVVHRTLNRNFVLMIVVLFVFDSSHIFSNNSHSNSRRNTFLPSYFVYYLRIILVFHCQTRYLKNNNNNYIFVSNFQLFEQFTKACVVCFNFYRKIFADWKLWLVVSVNGDGIKRKGVCFMKIKSNTFDSK